jgi:Flp pilus assembly protein TadG
MLLSGIYNLWKSPLTLTEEKSSRAQGSIRRALAPGLRKRRGAVTVELAIVSPFVFLIILGIIELSRGIMVIHLLNDAAQAGCRVGIVEGKTTANIKDVVVNALTAAGVNGEIATVQVNDASADASTAVAGDEITVLVKVPISSISWIPVARFLNGSLQGQYTMRRE